MADKGVLFSDAYAFSLNDFDKTLLWLHTWPFNLLEGAHALLEAIPSMPGTEIFASQGETHLMFTLAVDWYQDLSTQQRPRLAMSMCHNLNNAQTRFCHWLFWGYRVNSIDWIKESDLLNRDIVLPILCIECLHYNCLLCLTSHTEVCNADPLLRAAISITRLWLYKDIDQLRPL